MSISVTLPVGIELKDWADSLIIDFDAYGVSQPLDDVTQWQDWAMQYVRATNLVEDFPDPYSYAVTEWRDWAERFVQTTL
jgi:hypothetical protein